MIYEEVRDKRQMRALTGLTISQFEHLVSEFAIDYQDQQEQSYHKAEPQANVNVVQEAEQKVSYLK